MAEEAQFQCLRCGNEFTDAYSTGQVVERVCPKCRSNSVRRIKAPTPQDSKHQVKK